MGPAGPPGTGTVNSITAAAPLSGGTITTAGTIGLTTAGIPGTYGSGTTVPVITTDAWGRVTGVVNTPIATSGVGTVTSITATPPLTGGTITSSGSIGLGTTGITAATYGSSSAVPVITADAYGRITGITTASISGGGITSSGTTNYISKFTSATNVGNSAMYQDATTNDVGIGTLAPIATVDAESSTDTMAGRFVISNPTPPGNGVLSATYSGTGTSTSPVAIYGTATGAGVVGFGGSVGISGVAETIDGFGGVAGAQGQSFSDGLESYGVIGAANAYAFGAEYNYGVYGTTDGTGTVDDEAGEFNGGLDCTGLVSAAIKAFKIDHPLDPANKYLYHTCVESNDMMDIYNGNVTTDASGTATVTLPSYFEALNKDFRYQLTVIGSFAQAMVSKEEAGNSFEIKTNQPNVKVSWQITGIRHDAFATAHPVIPEVEKNAKIKGKYVHPELFGKSKDLSIVNISPKKLAEMKAARTKFEAQKNNTNIPANQAEKK
jgi:hypothetical protein